MSESVGVSIEDVRRVAELANLELTAEEEPRMQRDLSAVLGYIAELNELDTAGVPAMAQVGEMLGLLEQKHGETLRHLLDGYHVLIVLLAIRHRSFNR